MFGPIKICHRFALAKAVWSLSLGLNIFCITEIAAAQEVPPPTESIQELLDAGQAMVEFYDPVTNPRRFLGETKHDYAFRHQFRAHYEPVRAGGRIRHVDIRLSEVTYEIKLKNVIYLPESMRGKQVWQENLTLHELDHVALTVHPRMTRLLEEIYKSEQKMRLPLPEGEELNSDWVQKAVERQFNMRTQAVLNMISFNNKRLDQATQHGVKPIPDRAAFFEQLFSKQNLDEAEFPLTGEMLPLLKSEAYQKLEPIYLP